MALYSDMNGFPESGFPVLVDVEDRLTLNTLHYLPLKHLGYKLDVLGNNRLLGALVLGGGLSGVTTIAMAGALSGATTIAMNGAFSGASTITASGNVTLSGGNLLITIGEIGSILGQVKKAWLKDLYIKNRPSCGDDDFVALLSDFASLMSRTAKIGTDVDFMEVESDGTIKLNGNATVHDDLTGDITRTKTVGTRVTLNDVENTVDFTSSGTLTDYLFLNYQMSHKWKEGSSIAPHIHFEQEYNAVPNFLFQYRWQRQRNEKTTAWTPLVCNTAVDTFSGTTRNNLAYSALIPAPSGYSLSDIIQLRVIRDTTNASGLFGADPYTGTVRVTAVDIHYNIDTMGSRSEYSK